MGYIVVDVELFSKPQVLLGPKHPTHPVREGPANGVLKYAHAELTPTIFGTKRQAESAVKRTIDHWLKRYPDSAPEYKILTEQQYADYLESKSQRRRKQRQ